MNGFEDIKGNTFIIKSIKNTISHKKISHAYIIDGPSGSGKKLLANAIAKSLQCTEGVGEPCGRCVSCRSFDDRNHPDVFYIVPSKKIIGVDDIRTGVNAHINIKPYKYDYKIFIIEKAHTMTVEAQNALLKNIEEPPVYAVFILLSNNASFFLKTILSRCVCFKLKPLPAEIVESYLIQRGYPEEAAKMITPFSGGFIGQSLKIAEDDEFAALRKEAVQIVKSIRQKDLMSAFDAVKQLDHFRDQQSKEVKNKIDEALNILYLWYRDAAVYKSTKKTEQLLLKDMALDVAEFCEQRDIHLIIASLEAILQAKRALLYNGNFQMVMEVMTLQFAGL